MDNNELFLSKNNGIGTITLNRPEKLNSMTTDMWKRLLELIDEVDQDEDIKVLIVTGKGRGFCVGSDAGRLADRIAGKKIEVSRKEITALVGSEVLALANLRKPTIAAINGVAAASGLSIALACDIRIATKESRFLTSWLKMGLVPDCGATYFMPRLIGISKALEFLYTGNTINADEAERIGLVSRIVPDSELMTVTNDLATSISQAAPIAAEFTKKAVYYSLTRDLKSQLEFESYTQNICRKTDDYREGVEAYMQKRQPQFKGR